MNYSRVVCLVFLLLIEACSPSDNDSTSLPAAPQSTATTIPTSTSSSQTVPPTDYPPPTIALPEPVVSPESVVSPTTSRQEPIIILRQEGGFAGVMLQWVIYEDGRIIAEGSGPGAASGQHQVDPEAVAKLMDTLEDVGYFQERPVKANPVCCDFFSFTLTVRRGDQETTLSYSDGDESAPESFRLAVTAVQEFLEAALVTGSDTQ